MDKLKEYLKEYSKSEINSDLKDSIEIVEDNGNIDPLKSEDSHISEDYRKGTGTISSFLIIVISGGEVRESDYLKELSKKHTFPRIKLIFVSSEKNKGGLSPNMMYERMLEIIDFEESTKTQKIHYSSIDHIFMVSDVDHYYDELVELVSGCDDSKITWAISNPCFEMWLYYSYFDVIIPEIKFLETIPQSQQSSTLKTINGKIVKGGIDPRKAFELIETACKNSRATYSEDEKGIPQLYCTNLYSMGEYLIKAIGADEFNSWLIEKQKKIAEFKKRTI